MRITMYELKVSRATRFWIRLGLFRKVIILLHTGKELEFKREKKSKILTLSYSGTLRKWEKQLMVEVMELMGL